MKILHKSVLHATSRSHEFTVIEIKGTVFFLTYQIYNCAEHFTIEIFNGKEKSLLFSLYDLGESPHGSNYVQNEDFRKKRATDLFNKAVQILEKFIKKV